MARMTAAEAGRKGGRSRSAKKLAAIRRNGFQPCKNLPEIETAMAEPAVEVAAQVETPRPRGSVQPTIFVPRKVGEKND